MLSFVCATIFRSGGVCVRFVFGRTISGFVVFGFSEFLSCTVTCRIFSGRPVYLTDVLYFVSLVFLNCDLVSLLLLRLVGE